MTKSEYAKAVSLVTGLWPNNRWETATIRAGERLLLDLPGAHVLAAVEMLAAEGERYAPNPGQIRRKAIEVASRVRADDLPDADAALDEVYATIAKVGYYRSPVWSHPAIASTIDALGGWQAVCLDENPEAFRAHFLRLYATASARVAREQVAPESVRQLVTAGLDLSLGRSEEGAGHGVANPGVVQ